jgi:putative transposase
MAQRKVLFAPEEFYHVYNRGTDKRIIFHDFGDHKYFLDLLYLSNSTNPFIVREILETRTREELFIVDRGNLLVSIGAYCLMPNHFHILLQEKAEKGVSQFMHKLCTAYAMYFNTKYKRNGSLFQGPFQARHVDNDRYLKYLYAYIHLNPVKMVDGGWGDRKLVDKKKSQEHLAGYPFSSYLDYTDSPRPENTILSKEEFPKYFSTATDFKKMIAEWLAFDGAE